MAEKQLHWLVDAHCFDKEYQGSRTFVKELYTLLTQKKNIRFFFAAHDMEKLREVFPPAENMTLLSYRSRSAFVRLLIEIPHMVRQYNIDVAHFQYVTPFLKNCRQVVTLHDVLFCDFPHAFPFGYRLVRRLLFERSARKADVVTSVSGFSKQAIHKHFSIPLNRIHVLPNGVHNRFFELYDKQVCQQWINEKFGLDKYLLCVSRVEPRKNQDLLVKAFSELKLYQKGYHLLLVGYRSLPSPALQKVLSMAPEECRDSIRMIEQVSEEDLLLLYRAADVFVYPSGAEGFGIPPLEAAAARVPVICSNATALQSFAFFAPFHIEPSHEALKDALTRAITSPPPEHALKQTAILVQKLYSWERAAEKIYGLVTGIPGEEAMKQQKTQNQNQHPVAKATPTTKETTT